MENESVPFMQALKSGLKSPESSRRHRQLAVTLACAAAAASSPRQLRCIRCRCVARRYGESIFLWSILYTLEILLISRLYTLKILSKYLLHTQDTSLEYLLHTRSTFCDAVLKRFVQDMFDPVRSRNEISFSASAQRTFEACDSRVCSAAHAARRACLVHPGSQHATATNFSCPMQLRTHH
eukprot:6184364-Pleurochrysis_carterae.AAC.1